MNILNIENVSKIFGEKVILDKVKLGINKGDKIGIVGVNGTGKSTLLKIIAGLEESDEGRIVMGNSVTISYLPQKPHFEENESIIHYVMHGAKDADEAQAKTILTKLGIDDFEADITKLSGGQKKRIALARTLVDSCEVLILDEPTNHLDSEMVTWLENYIKGFRGELVMVTHDRYFLDNVTNRIVEIDRASLYSYATNYSGYLELKTQREDMEKATQDKRENILRTELEWIKRGCKASGKTSRKRNRIKVGKRRRGGTSK